MTLNFKQSKASYSSVGEATIQCAVKVCETSAIVSDFPKFSCSIEGIQNQNRQQKSHDRRKDWGKS